MDTKNDSFSDEEMLTRFLMEKLEASNRSLRSLALDIGINYQTLKSQIRNHNLRADSLVMASIVLVFNLNETKDLFERLKTETQFYGKSKVLRRAKQTIRDNREIYGMVLSLVKNKMDDIAEGIMQADELIRQAQRTYADSGDEKQVYSILSEVKSILNSLPNDVTEVEILKNYFAKRARELNYKEI